MKLVITEKEQGKIIAKQTVIKLVVNPFSSDAGKMPLSLYEAKGDLIAGKGVANPVRVAVGTDGQVLVADSNAEGGIGWKVMALGTATLRNSESVAVTAGTVVTTTGMTAGNFRVATAADTMNLFVAAENILSGQLGVIYNASGKDCTVKVTDGAVSAGDKLTVSATDGVAEVTTGADYFAQAITNKAAGAAGTVICVLVNTVQTIIPIEGGGTNASNAEGARDNLGVTALFNATTGHDHDGTDSKKIAASNVDGLADYFNASTGHDHDGTDSKKIAYSTLTGLPTLTPDGIGALPMNPASIELFPPSGASHGGFIDFHFNRSSADYTSRIIENGQGIITIDAILGVNNPPPTSALVRTIYAGTSAMTSGSSELTSGAIYLQYE